MIDDDLRATCGPDCVGTRRKSYCDDRTCGAPDCATCCGPGVDHSACDPQDETCPDDDDDEVMP